MFKLEFLPAGKPRLRECRGAITIGEFREEFSAPIGFWTQHDYREHWLWSARQLTGGARKSAFITEMIDPEKANFITWWPAYRFGEVILVQQQLLLFDRLASPFSLLRLADSVREHSEVTEDGDKISQWSTSVSELAAFAESSL